MSVFPLLSYINLLFKLRYKGLSNCGVLTFIICGVLWSKNKLWGSCYVKFIALPSFMCQFVND